MEKTFNEKMINLMDSQTAILAIQNNMTSSTALTCMKNLNNLGDSDDVTTTWTTGHTCIFGRVRFDYKLNC